MAFSNHADSRPSAVNPVSISTAGKIMTCGQLPLQALGQLLQAYGLRIAQVPEHQPIPGSFWGDSEAGLIANTLHVRADTPVHSALHEACHFICMDDLRRERLHTDAGGGYDEENGVCYLQILLADEIEGVGRARLMQDMDCWGYSFRLGSTSDWFYRDAEDVQLWLLRHGIITKECKPTYRLRKR